MSDALLAFADGTVMRGRAYGAKGEAFGEAVFNTALTGYQEVLTDPSYHGEIVTMTYPHQGNYGINSADGEAVRPWVRGFVVREGTPRPSSWRSDESLESFLVRNNIVAIEAVDTRAIVRRLRTAGAMTVGISSQDTGESELVERVRAAPDISGIDLVREVTPKQAYDVDANDLRSGSELDPSFDSRDARTEGLKIAAIDYGMKRNILRCLSGLGFAVRVFPATVTSDELLEWSPDGVFLSNGPGDPSALSYAVETIRGVLQRKIPTFGICLGHQLLSTALGGSTYKLKFGHRGINHPVKCLRTGRVEITTQNHGFCVTTSGLPSDTSAAFESMAASKVDDRIWESDFGDVELSHFNLNDGTLEGIRCREVPAFAVQYHPEAAPGPHDSRYLFDDFVELITGEKTGGTDAGR